MKRHGRQASPRLRLTKHPLKAGPKPAENGLVTGRARCGTPGHSNAWFGNRPQPFKKTAPEQEKTTPQQGVFMHIYGSQPQVFF